MKICSTHIFIIFAAVMPPESCQDFDLHLVQAVRGMKELQQDLAASK